VAVNWPSSLTPTTLEIGIKSNTQVSVSDLSGYVQTVELPGARWSMSISMPPLKREDSAALEAFIAKLRGQAVRAVMPVFSRSTPRGTWGGSPVVNNNAGSPTLSQTGTTLETSGFTAFTTVKAGDYFNIGSGGELHMVTDDATADSAGRATLSIQPAIRTAPAQSTALVFNSPVVPLMILTDPHPRWRITPGDINQFDLDFIEVFV
jgi:hypothetical protein